MPIFGPFYFQYDGREVTVDVHVDPARIAQDLALKAIRNHNGVAKLCGGAVMVVDRTNDPPNDTKM